MMDLAAHLALLREVRDLWDEHGMGGGEHVYVDLLHDRLVESIKQLEKETKKPHDEN